MGYDVSFHPISSKEMEEWYFTPLEWVRQGRRKKRWNWSPPKSPAGMGICWKK